MKIKILRDPVHGYVSLTEKDLKFIDSLSFQRLRRIKQSGCHTVYPSANHTRFEHSIGVMHLGTRVFETILRKLPSEALDSISPHLNLLRNTVRYACLLHDVGHTPLSHTGEFLFDKKLLQDKLLKITGLSLEQGAPHEYLSCIVALEIFGTQLDSIGFDKELFCRMITGNLYKGKIDALSKFKNGIIEILNSSIDVDKLDYFSRDSFTSGTSNTLVSIDTERLISAYNIIGGTLCFDSSALSVVANFVYARNTLYMWVYNHHVTIYTDNLVQTFLKSLIEQFPQLGEKFFSIGAILDRHVDDYDIMKLFKTMRNISPLHSCLYNQLYGRQYYKALWKNQFQLRELFSKEDAQLEQFKETDPQVIENRLRSELALKNDFDLFVFRANYKFKKPKVFLNLGGTTRDFANIYQQNIYSSLIDTIPMVYANPNLDIEWVRNKTKSLFIT